MGSPGVPGGRSLGAGGSSLTQVAPMAWQRISAAGPGRLSARLRMRTPLSGLKVGALAGDSGRATAFAEALAGDFDGEFGDDLGDNLDGGLTGFICYIICS